MNFQQFESRKREHIRHSLNSAHQAGGLSGLDQIHLIHEALPELDFSEIVLSTLCFGKQLSTPFYVAGMTAGHQDAIEINRTLALACQERGWAMGVGSQRRELEMHEPEMTKTQQKRVDSWRKLREEVPELVLFANIGIAQLVQTPVSKIRRLLEELNAQALAVHTNALQEVLQPEGTPNFRGGMAALQRACEELGRPVLLKETGCGFSARTLEKLSGMGLAAVDVSGLGGTHWGRIEGARAGSGSIQEAASATFASWGESTVRSVMAASASFNKGKSNPGKSAGHKGKNVSQGETWASGGVRSGLDAAKLIALGAHRVGYAQPALEAALAGPEKLRLWMATQEFELKVALFCTGSSRCEVLRNKEGVWRPNDT